MVLEISVDLVLIRPQGRIINLTKGEADTKHMTIEGPKEVVYKTKCACRDIKPEINQSLVEEDPSNNVIILEVVEDLRTCLTKLTFLEIPNMEEMKGYLTINIEQGNKILMAEGIKV